MTPTRLVTEAALSEALGTVYGDGDPPLTDHEYGAAAIFAALPERPALDEEAGELVCPWCGAEGYDNAIRLEGDPIRASRCGSCWNDIRTETIHERLSRERA